jgi:hypothetical protein
MERNTKILLGIGAVALGYYLYTKNKAKSEPQPSSVNPCKGENQVPCSNGSGKCYMANAQYITDPCKIDKPQPSQEPRKPQSPFMPRVQSSPQNSCFLKSGISVVLGKFENGKCVPAPPKTVIYTCMDGKRVERDETYTESTTIVNPCGTNGGVKTRTEK